jgi:hypothetical protein|tara:strand:- start:1270 stop:2016 length:747 start_codon:yes stop_codon:yes gene_type:complete
MEVNMAESTEKVLERIAKLMQMADGGTKHEAEVASKMAQKLLIKHNLSMADVDTNIDEAEKAIMDELFNMRDVWKKVEGNWIASLYHVVATNNLCRIITQSGGRWKNIYVIGTKANVSMVHFMCQQLIPRLREAEKQEWSWYNGWDKRGVFKRGFFQGAVSGINSQLRVQMQQLQQENKNVEGLVIYNDKAVGDYVSGKWPKLGKGRSSSTSSADGYRSGRNVGKNMSIRKGVGGSKTSYGGMLGNGK